MATVYSGEDGSIIASREPMTEVEMSSKNNNRYQRQQILPEMGADGQLKLAQSTVFIVGCGALGCFQANLLARAGLGKS